MSRTRLRQVARLERCALPYIERKRRYDGETAASLRESAFRRAASVALLILHGDPRLGEPLRDAWVRCLQSPAWKACRAKHPDYIGRYDEEAPFNMLGARGLAQYFRSYFLPELPGADETEKLNAVFAKAPIWLLWFTHADVIGVVLGLKVPDLSTKARFGRPGITLVLPDGTFEWRRLPDGAEDKWNAMARQHRRERLALPDNLTTRERRRVLRLTMPRWERLCTRSQVRS
jgi:hypothetical protein